MRTRILTLIVAGLLMQGAALADTWAEVGDAGDLPGTAQGTSGSPLDFITGVISSSSDVDMFSIYLDGTVSFGATTVGGAAFDTQLFLFDSAGLGIVSNDDAVGFQSTISATVGAGIYYLAIGSFNREPSSVGGLIFADNILGLNGPTGPGGASPVTSWSGGGASGSYSIELRNAYASTVPEPMSMLLLGSAMLGLGVVARRRSKVQR